MARGRERSPSPRRARNESPRRGPRPRSRSRDRPPAAAARDTDSAANRQYSSIIASAMGGGGGEDGGGPQWGRREDREEAAGADGEPPAEKQRPSFALSGALAKDARTGNTKQGVVLKWSEPPEARVPARRWRLYVFKSEELLETLHVHKQSGFLIGRDPTVADIHVAHGSCSKQHAVLQFRLVERDTGTCEGPERRVLPYIMDLESTNGTSVNGERVPPAQFYELRARDVIRFGQSTREYVLIDPSG